MSFISKIISLLYPRRCPYCRNIIEENEYACEKCRNDFPKDDILTGAYGHRCISPFPYKDNYKKALLTFKFRDKEQYAPLLSYPMYECIKRQFGDIDFDIITCVPMHKKDFRKKGYNHSKLLAKEIAKFLGVSYLDTLLKTKQTPKQHKLPLSKRKTNLKGAFKLADKEIVKGKTILLVDDVITTGATLSFCSKELLKGNPKNIYCVTLTNATVKY
ncbi:MAG: ComF family protein [Oscillospiraceae bacterium]|nr:ComF family protein [Candidatus Ruminococcus equi]